MWGQKPEPSTSARDIEDIKSSHRLELVELKKNHELALKEKEFEMRHFKDDELKKVQGELTAVQQANAVLKKENEMLEKITNLNADIIDIKSLVANLIEKLPTINLSSLTLNGNSDK